MWCVVEIPLCLVSLECRFQEEVKLLQLENEATGNSV